MTPSESPPLDPGTKVITVQRCCNGCGKQLRDVREDEVEAAIAGASLPDVRSECPSCSAAPLDLQELEELVAALPFGDWEVSEEGEDVYLQAVGETEYGHIASFPIGLTYLPSFIAAARNALPSLLARVRDLEEENRQLRARIAKIQKWAERIPPHEPNPKDGYRYAKHEVVALLDGSSRMRTEDS